jgi:ribosomal protein S18 acetylase RimI-like enzyme
MKTEHEFDIEFHDYSVCRLTLRDTQAIQILLEECQDYMLLVDGHPAGTDAAERLLQEMPPEILPDNKFMFGIMHPIKGLVGLLETIRGYPEEAVWWIGLLLIAPESRSQGLGQKIFSGFVEYIKADGGKAIMLGVVEENERAYLFWNRMGFELVRKTEPRQSGDKTQTVSIMGRVI